MLGIRWNRVVLIVMVFMVMPVFGQGLFRVIRQSNEDMGLLTSAGVDVVAVFNHSLFAWGPEDKVRATLDDLGYSSTLVDANGFEYWIAGLRPGWTDAHLSSCGQVIWAEDNWVLLEASAQLDKSCLSSPFFTLAPMPLRPFAVPKLPPAEYEHLMDGQRQPQVVKPMVQDMVADLTSAKALEHWNGVINAASTRYSTSSGCQTAAEAIFDWFESWGLQAEFQYHTSGHAPNVIGTLPGKTEPEKVYIMIGHLDDLPSSGNAPGADDNASGSATVTALAELTSAYGFAYTVKFLAVTGEEFGLYGSTAYADDALSRGEDIQGVLNADMTGWEGDGIPNPENLDLNYNDNSQWLGLLFAQLATDYQTGCVVDAFSCPGLTASDHAPFWSRGYSAVCGITDNEGYCGHEGHYPYYHTSDDTLANCGDTTFFISAAKTYLATLAHLADPLCVNPDPPTSVVANADGDNRILISWDPGGSGQTFEIFRAPEGCGYWDDAYKIGETAQNQYLDDQASGQIAYGYFVFSIDSTGFCRSRESGCAEATTTGVCMEPPNYDSTVSTVNLQETACGIELNWPSAAPRCGTEITYNIYRDQDPEFVPDNDNLIAQCISGTQYVDRSIGSSTSYFYVVRAEDNSGNGGGPCSGGNESFNTNSVGGIATGPDTILFSDDLEAGQSAWLTLALPGDTGTNPWSVETTASHSASHAWFCLDEEDVKDQVIVLAQPLNIPSITGAVLSFWHLVDTEYRWDGGVLEYSVDGGGSWFDILAGNGLQIPQDPNRVSQGSYPTNLRTSSNPLGGRQAWTGSTSGFEKVVVDLANFSGHSVLLRWRLGCDSSVDAPGWWVDDVTVYFPSACTSGPCDFPTVYSSWLSTYSILDFISCLDANFGFPPESAH